MKNIYASKGHWGIRVEWLSRGYGWQQNRSPLFRTPWFAVTLYRDFVIGWRGALDLGWIAIHGVSK